MSASYSVRLRKESLIFSAAHFITIHGDICERLHGHNYGVEVTVHGELDENGYVIDFIALRDSLQRIVSALDHRMLLPQHHPFIKVESTPDEILVTFRQRRWIFPSDNCVILPIAQTTAELLAAYIGGQLRAALGHERHASEWRFEVAVDENNGQWGVWLE